MNRSAVRLPVMMLAVLAMFGTVYVFLFVPETSCAFSPMFALLLGLVAFAGSSAAFVLAGRSGDSRHRTTLGSALPPLVIALLVLGFVVSRLLAYAFCVPA